MSSFDKSLTLTHKNMTNQSLRFEDFQIEKLSKNQQKTVQGGENNDSIDPSKGTGKGSN